MKAGIMIKSKFYVAASFMLLGLIIICYTIITTLGQDVSAYAAFAAPIIAMLLGMVAIAKQVDDVREKVDVVQHQTNGQLKAQFDELKEHVTESIKEVK